MRRGPAWLLAEAQPVGRLLDVTVRVLRDGPDASSRAGGTAATSDATISSQRQHGESGGSIAIIATAIDDGQWFLHGLFS